MFRSFLFFPALAIACTDVKSSSIATDGIYMDYNVVSEGVGTGTQANAVLRVGGVTSTTFVDLDGGDTLAASSGSEEHNLSQSSLGVLHSYDADFDVDAVGSEFVLRFDRESFDSAPSSIATLPEEFSITAPATESSFSRSADIDIEVTWESTSSDPMTIQLTGDCIGLYVATEPVDNGTHTISMAEIEEDQMDDFSTCTAELVIERRKGGSLDSAFGGGTVFGAQKRTIQLKLEP